MENNISNYEELGLTAEQKEESWDYLSEMQCYLDEKSSGELLKKLLDEKHLTFGQKFYMAYIFGRLEDKWIEYLDIQNDAE
jgi:hypothetical protein